jgi:hypothetical protein
MLYLPYGLSNSCLQFNLKIKIIPPPLSFLILSLPFHIFFIHPISLPFSFIFLPVPFSPYLSHFATSIPHVRDCVSLLVAHSVPSFLSFRLTPVFSLLVLTSKSRHHFLSRALSLPGNSGIPFSCTSHTFCCIWILSFSPFFLACLCLCPFHSGPLSFIYLPFALNLSTSSLAYPFLW